jgi:hypothetical protein
MRSKVEIVFRRKVRAIWLDQGMILAAQGADWSEAKPLLAKEIVAENSGAVTISKVLEHIRRIWFEPPDDALALRADALRLYKATASPDTKLLLNWGMTVAAYPFVGSAGEALGRLLKLQKEARRVDVQRRLREQYGDRDFVNRIARYTVSSFLDWGIIVETKHKGIYFSGKQAKPKNHEQLAWLAEAALISRGKTQMALSELSSQPVFFPIKLDSINASLLRVNPRLRVERHNFNQETVLLVSSNRNGE